MGQVSGWAWNFCFLLTVTSDVFYQLMCFYDLEFDYLNPYDVATRTVKFVLAEYLGLGLIFLANILAGHWIMCLLSLPHLVYNVKLYMQRQHLIDITEIYNQLESHKKIRLYKLGHLVALTLMTLIGLVNAIEEDFD